MVPAAGRRSETGAITKSRSSQLAARAERLSSRARRKKRAKVASCRMQTRTDGVSRHSKRKLAGKGGESMQGQSDLTCGILSESLANRLPP